MRLMTFKKDGTGDKGGARQVPLFTVLLKVLESWGRRDGSVVKSPD
jgi:hypothetical protein